MFEVTVTSNDSGLVNVRHAEGKTFKVLAATCFTSARPGGSVQEVRIKPREEKKSPHQWKFDAVLLRDSAGRLALLATGINVKKEKPFLYTNEQIVYAEIRDGWQIYVTDDGPDFFEIIVGRESGGDLYSTNPAKTYAEFGSSKIWTIRSVSEMSGDLGLLLHWLCGDIDAVVLFTQLGRPEKYMPEA